MGIPYTESGYNMYDMLSTIQKGIRRGNYELAGWGAKQLQGSFRSVMWNRMFVISSEDCYGILTKEIVALREKDFQERDNRYISNAMALLCRARKSRDACYFSCNFVLDHRNPRDVSVSDEEMAAYAERVKRPGAKGGYDQFGFRQYNLFGLDEDEEEKPEYQEIEFTGCKLEKAIAHRDMDMMGYYIDKLRGDDRQYLWTILKDYADHHSQGVASEEIKALERADETLNGKKAKDKRDEIFISKAAMILCYAEDDRLASVFSNDGISSDKILDWSRLDVKPIEDCVLENGKIPDYVFDCHTIKGKKAGKTDWDMTRDEQEALFPLYRAYFDDASWIYTYEQDFRNGVMNNASMAPIRKYAETHPANPVEYIPYD